LDATRGCRSLRSIPGWKLWSALVPVSPLAVHHRVAVSHPVVTGDRPGVDGGGGAGGAGGRAPLGAGGLGTGFGGVPGGLRLLRFAARATRAVPARLPLPTGARGVAGGRDRPHRSRGGGPDPAGLLRPPAGERSRVGGWDGLPFAGAHLPSTPRHSRAAATAAGGVRPRVGPRPPGAGLRAAAPPEVAAGGGRAGLRRGVRPRHHPRDRPWCGGSGVVHPGAADPGVPLGSA